MEKQDELVHALAVLREAATTVPEETATEAIQRAHRRLGVPADVMRVVQDAFASALERPILGSGNSFHTSVIQTAIRVIEERQIGTLIKIGGSRAEVPVTPAVSKSEAAPTSERGTGGVTVSRRYIVGDEYQTVAVLGLKPTEPARGATCPYQFSRHTARPGVIDLPAGTTVTYMSVGPVYPSQTSSKRMMFSVKAGTKCALDGVEMTLEADTVVAGVSNHIDPEDAYNVQLRENEAKKQTKRTIRTSNSKAA